MVGSATNPWHKIALGAAVALVHLALLAYFLLSLHASAPAPVDRSLRLIEVAVRPAPPPAVRRQAARHAHIRLNARAASIPVSAVPAAPPAIIVPPVALTPPMVVGDAPEVAGPGGDGRSGGGSGGGDGQGGGDGRRGTPPIRIRGHISDRDYPAAFAAAGIGGIVSVRYRVDVDGRVRDCIAAGSSGYPALDALTCGLIEKRFRFRPSRDQYGRPVSSIIVENHDWVMLADPRPAGGP